VPLNAGSAAFEIAVDRHFGDSAKPYRM